jgi:hypothetical protein
MNKNKKNKKNGSALIISLLCLSMLGVVVLNIGGVVRSEYLSSSTRYSGSGFQASYNAFSGVQYAIDKILADLGDNDIDGIAAASGDIDIHENGSSEDASLRDIDFTVSWTPGTTIAQDGVDPDIITITSEGTSGGSSIKARVMIQIERDLKSTASSDKYTFLAKIVSWEEEVQ